MLSIDAMNCTSICPPKSWAHELHYHNIIHTWRMFFWLCASALLQRAEPVTSRSYVTSPGPRYR